jgi:hypothetical protein
MRFTACGCPAEHYRRGHRPWWMRLAGSDRRLFHCYGCDARMLISQAEVARRLLDEGRRKRRAEREAVAH